MIHDVYVLKQASKFQEKSIFCEITCLLNVSQNKESLTPSCRGTFTQYPLPLPTPILDTWPPPTKETLSLSLHIQCYDKEIFLLYYWKKA